MRWLPVALLLAACPAEEPLLWYTTCGSPACGGYSGPFEGVPVCDAERAGDVCDDPDATCDLQNDCDERLVCTREDPQEQPGGCPISRRDTKRDIRALSAAEREAAAAAALAVPLSSWRYLSDPPEAPSRLGFVIDEVGQSPAVAPGGRHVDVYGYTSMTLAAVQAEHARVQALEAEVAALRAEVEALRAATRP